MPTPSDPISLGIAHQRLLCWGQGGARAAVSLLKLWWVRLGLEAPGTIPPLGTSLSREAGRGPVLVTAPHALAFGAFLVPFCLFVWCFSKYSPKKSHPCSMQSQEHLAWHPLPMAQWPGAAGERCAPGVLVPSPSNKRDTPGEFPLCQTHFHQAHIKGHRFILF